MNPGMKPYTVLVLRPEYTTTNFGEDTYLDWVWSDNAEDAGRQAQVNAASVSEVIADYPADIHYEDYFVIAIFEGHLIDLSGHD